MDPVKQAQLPPHIQEWIRQRDALFDALVDLYIPDGFMDVMPWDTPLDRYRDEILSEFTAYFNENYITKGEAG